MWPGVGGYERFWLGVGGSGWLTFFWLGVGECDVFLAGCGWMWVSVTYFCLSVGECGCGLFLAECGWVWVSARFITMHKKSCLGFQSVFFNFFCLVYIKWLIICMYKSLNISIGKIQKC